MNKKQETWNPELNAEENFELGKASMLQDVLEKIDKLECCCYDCIEFCREDQHKGKPVAIGVEELKAMLTEKK